MTFQLIDQERAHHAVSRLCSVLNVSRQGYWAWTRRPPSPRRLADEQLKPRILAAWRESDHTYGAPRLHAELRLGAGVRVGRKRVARLMRELEIQGVSRRRGRVRTTIPDTRAAPAPDLVNRDFRASRPDETWVADITYVPTHEGWLFLAAVMDLYSRRIVGWSMREDLEAPLVVDAISMAISRRKPKPGLVHHSDRGSQGGFNRSSQRSTGRSCDEREEAEVGSDWSADDAVAGASAGRASGAPSAVLGGDRSRCVKRGRCRRGGSLGGCWCPLVPGGWRDAINHQGPAFGPLPVLPRAGRDRALARPQLWRARDRASTRPLALDDLERAPSQRRDPQRILRVPGQHRAVARRPPRPAPESGEARQQHEVAPLRAGPAVRCCRAPGRDRCGRPQSGVDRPASRPAQGPALGEVVEPGADLRSAVKSQDVV
jgi:hypothetical protein